MGKGIYIHKPRSEETKIKISKTMEGKPQPWNRGENSYLWKGGMPKCVDCGTQLASYKSKYCKNHYTEKQKINKRTLEEYRAMGLKGLLVQQNSKQPTSIEKTLYDYLLLKGILFERQHLVNGKFLVDAYIPSLNLVIEADGKYWHGLDRVMKKDKAENAYLKACGFKMVRLTEAEINSGEFKERLVL